MRKLLRRAVWTDFAKDDCIARQGVHLERLILIAGGEAAVLLGGRIVARLKAGEFVGEITYLSGEPATATVVVTKALRCAVWHKDDLQNLLDRRPELLTIVHAAIGKDMAAKIASHNLTLSQV